MLLELLADLDQSPRFVHEFLFLVNHPLLLQAEEGFLLLDLGILLRQDVNLLVNLILLLNDVPLLLSKSKCLGVLVESVETELEPSINHLGNRLEENS